MEPPAVAVAAKTPRRPVPHPILCKPCETVHADRPSFLRHVLEAHPDNLDARPTYSCPICRKDADDYDRFRNHHNNHLTRDRFRCDLCDKSFPRSTHLKRHVEALHGNPHECDRCGKSFSSVSGLKIHVESRHSEARTVYDCHRCGKRLRSRNGLAIHLASHEFGRRFVCDLCGAAFAQKINLSVHIGRLHRERRFVCQTCQKAFHSESALKTHAAHHASVRMFRCKICDKTFKTERYMRSHFARHNSAGAYSCSVCHKGFISRYKLKQHTNVHTGEKPYKCQFCNLGFTNFPNCSKHVRRMHKEKFQRPSDSADAPKLSIPRSLENDIVAGGPDRISKIKNRRIELDLTAEEFISTSDDIPQTDFDVSKNSNLDFILTRQMSPNEIDRIYNLLCVNSNVIFSNENIAFPRDNEANNLSEAAVSMSATLKEELELSHSYIREQMNGCDFYSYMRSPISETKYDVNKCYIESQDEMKNIS